MTITNSANAVVFTAAIAQANVQSISTSDCPTDIRASDGSTVQCYMALVTI